MPRGEEFLGAKEISFGLLNFIPVFFRELLFDFLFFIVWWYTAGLKRISTNLLNEFLKALRRLSLRIFLKNIFNPLYGDYSRSGRIIGFVLRSIIFVVLIITAFIWLVLLFVVLAGWIFAPLLFLYFLLRQII